MPHVERELLQTWTRSFEEDEGDVHVYRPASHTFPRQRRPRDTIEFRPDGTLVRLVPGRADKREREESRWYAELPGRLRATGVPGQQDMLLEVLHVDAGLLKLRGLP
jgi:hypothetical protein